MLGLSRLTRGDESANEEARRHLAGAAANCPRACHAPRQQDDRGRHLQASTTSGAGCACFLRTPRSAPRAAPLAHLPAGEKHDEALFNQAATAPKKLLASLPKNMEVRATREMVLFAMVRLGRSEPDAAVEVLQAGKLTARLPDEDVKYLWAVSPMKARGA